MQSSLESKLSTKSSVRLRYASKAEFQTNTYKNSVKSDDFTEFLVRPTRFERATYRVGVFRRILIKCCVFKGCTIFSENAAFSGLLQNH